MRKKIVFYLNGIRKEEGADKAGMMLAEYLRYDQNLTGTKIVCAEGDCGACTVLRYFPQAHPGTDTDNFLPVNSCITILAQLDGSSLVTVDALKHQQELHAAQKAMVSCHGSQCGFCTPGFVMALTGLVEEKLCRKEVSISEQEAKNALTGNLCRCTGYKPIIEAATSMDLTDCESVKARFYTPHLATELSKVIAEGVRIESEDFAFFAPTTIKDALDFLASDPQIRILGSGTDLGVVHNKRKTELTKLLSLHLVQELYRVEVSGTEVSVGARVTHSEFRHALKHHLPEFSQYLDIFASPQIKNIGTVVGNIANASPIGDTPPAFLALGARLEIQGPGGTREEELSTFFVAYRTTTLRPGELITKIKFPLPQAPYSLRLFKTSIRKDLDISSVNLAIRVDWQDPQQTEVRDIALAAGGVAATPLRLRRTEDLLRGKKLDAGLLDQAAQLLQTEFTPLSDVRASAAYRRVLMDNLFRRFFAEAGGVA
jgi:xanthine dehydrogenase small subunit